MPGAGGRCPDGRDVLAALDRDLEADPVLTGLRDQLVGTTPPREARASRSLLVAGLALLVLACLTLSTAIAAAGAATALLAFHPPLRAGLASLRRLRRGR